MRIIHTDQIDPAIIPKRDKLPLYNGLDCLICREVFDEIHPLLDETSAAIYRFSRALQAPVLEIDLRGVLVDSFQRAKMIRQLSSDLILLEQLLNRYALATWGQPLNARSSIQKMQYLYDLAGCKEVRKFDFKKQESKRTADREAIERTHKNYPKVRPITTVLLAIMDTSKQLQTLKSGVDPDGYFRASYNIAGTETGRFSSKKNAFGTGCFPPGAEVLTPNGWFPLEKVSDGQVICQYENGNLSWTPAIPYQTHYEGEILSCNGEQISFDVTADHRVPVRCRKTKRLSVYPAHGAAKRSDYHIPLSGQLNGNQTFPRLIIALLADGHNDYGCHWRISFKKARKIKRFLELCSEAEITPVPQSAKPGYQRFALTVPEHWPTSFASWIFSAENAEDLLDECAAWDGTQRNKSFKFYSASKEQCEWVQTLAHICGRSATIYSQEQSPGSYSTTKMWVTNVKPRNFAHIIKPHWSSYSYSGPVYCVTVPSSLFLVRWKGKISVTGNSNGQNWKEHLRIIFTCPEGPIPNRDSYNIPEEFR